MPTVSPLNAQNFLSILYRIPRTPARQNAAFAKYICVVRRAIVSNPTVYYINIRNLQI